MRSIALVTLVVAGLSGCANDLESNAHCIETGETSQGVYVQLLESAYAQGHCMKLTPRDAEIEAEQKAEMERAEAAGETPKMKPEWSEDPAGTMFVKIRPDGSVWVPLSTPNKYYLKVLVPFPNDPYCNHTWLHELDWESGLESVILNRSPQCA